MPETFETVLQGRVHAMLDACTRCGRCVEVCPATGPAGVEAAPREVIEGVVDILRTGAGPEASRRWASGCLLSGECIKACDEGVNPRFLLAMARVALARAEDDPATQRRNAVDAFRKVAREVTHLSQMQLDDALLARLGQGATAASARRDAAEPPDFVFYTGCNVLKTPHIALLALDIMDALGVTYRVMGGPAHCCGIIQLRAGDTEVSGRQALSSLAKLAEGKTGVISWCASCHQQFTETTLPAVERMTGARPFEMTPFMLFLQSRFAQLRPLLKHPVPLRVALHKHPGIKGVVEAATALLAMVPGIELVELAQPAV